MEGDAIISTAIQLLVTSALGGHATSGDVVFIETKPGCEKDKKKATLVEEINTALSPILNEIAFMTAYTGAIFGDSYGRVYARPKEGVININVSEFVRPPLVLPVERGHRTVGFRVYTSKNGFVDLDLGQMARLKMPRHYWVPQPEIIERAFRTNLLENDPYSENLHLLPASVGGSFLFQAEEAYDNLYASILGMVGQRWINAIDEETLAVQTEGMTKDQRERFIKNIVSILQKSKQYAEQAMQGGMPVLEKVRHVIPISREKQLTSIAEGVTTKNQNTIQVDDILFHAKLLAAALGTDLSMLGFADQLSGGLGEGGFFRVSAQAAERARVIRNSLSGFFHQVVDIHTFSRYGFVFKPSERPYQLNYYGSISALEKEKAQTQMESMNAAGMMLQGMQMMKELGFKEESTQQILNRQYKLEEDEAKTYAKDLVAAAEEEIAREEQANAPDDMYGGEGAGMDGADDDYVSDEQPPKKPLNSDKADE